MSAHATEQPEPAPVDPPSSGGDDESSLTRLEVRLQPTQIALLDGMGRRLTRERRKAGRTGRRLNKSALIRAAVSVLTEARGQIHGATEAEIADSLKRWLASGGGHTDPLPRQTRDALREARRQLAAVDRVLARASDLAPGATSEADASGNAPDSPQFAPEASQPPHLPQTPERP